MYAKSYNVKYLTVLGVLTLSISFTACINKGDVDSFIDQAYDKGLDVSVIEPVDYSFADIKNSGTLRMITRYSSNTYFLHQGIEWGFEYELVSEFAKEHNLALDILVVGPDENPYDMLNSGEGDIIAANYTITPEREKYVDFTRAYNVVDQLLVYADDIEDPPKTLEEHARREIPITVRRNSSYYYRLRELQKQFDGLRIDIASNEKDTEALLFDISNGTYKATVADNNIFQASSKYMLGLVKGPVIAENDTIAWAIRSNAPELKTQLNRFLYKHFRFGGGDEPAKRSTFLNVLRKRYFEEGPQIARYYNPESKIEKSGIISPYDDLIKSLADSAGLDWLMITSMVAQETKFNPESKSWAGAIGLMQVMPRFSEIDQESLYDEETNIREGIRIISEHLRHYSYMDTTNQWAFALATYNAGLGHLADARRLAIDQNKNPNEWENASDALLKLMQRKYYKDARYGFCRGIETVRYVKEVMNRHRTYESILAIAEERDKPSLPGVVGIFN